MNLVKSIFTGREPVLYTALVRQAIVLGAAFGLELTAEQTAAVMGMVEVLVWLFLRTKVSPFPAKGSGKGTLASIVFVVALAIPLSGCELIEKATGFLGAQYAQYGQQAEQMFDLLCGRSEARARGRSFRGVEQDRSFIEDVCRSEEAIDTYGPLVLQALEQGQGRAMARARARKAE